MNIIVLIKHVPNTSKVTIDQNTGNLVRDGIDSIVNPNDLHAIETSLFLRDLYGGNITAVTMGPPQSIDALSEVLGMGVNSALLLSDKAFSGADTWATSKTLGRAINLLGKYHLIICGKQAIDGDTAQVGPQVAAFLNIPQLTNIFEVNFIKPDKINVKRKTDYGYDHVQCTLPALISVNSNINKPRYPNISNLIKACKKNSDIKIWNAADIGFKVSEVGINGSLTQVIETISPNFERQNQILEGNTATIIKTLFYNMKDNYLV